MNATHTHMTNSLNTPAEALEYSYPLRVREYRIRKGSGGKGRQKGGDGSVREIEVLAASRMSLLSDRRKRAPYGLQGGDAGALGRAFIIRADGRNSSPQKEVGICSPAIACGLKPRAVEGLGKPGSSPKSDPRNHTKKSFSCQLRVVSWIVILF
jgi:N-methylhydantoinase B